MARVIWPDNVIDQLDQIIAYIELFDPSAAARMKDRLFALGESLKSFPNRGRPAQDGTREMTTVSPYILSYEMAGDIVNIVDIRHAARRARD